MTDAEMLRETSAAICKVRYRDEGCECTNGIYAALQCKCEDIARDILARIRPHLEARGIEMAAEHLHTKHNDVWKRDDIAELRTLARQHATAK